MLSRLHERSVLWTHCGIGLARICSVASALQQANLVTSRIRNNPASLPRREPGGQCGYHARGLCPMYVHLDRAQTVKDGSLHDFMHEEQDIVGRWFCGRGLQHHRMGVALKH
ncbi:hypothetical protein DAEQUDRAFT_254431 [Daedalea quercina L-15889]|uniref:Uncharacterized protein n=1 Tax=Daedalea quercina L-15889 TaxID=1314783 RepID=A0A165QI38_9APHY|nr:hypothetical protein DAEQUDRAFT_254431 [Daedalea quercina L-15889]